MATAGGILVTRPSDATGERGVGDGTPSTGAAIGLIALIALQ